MDACGNLEVVWEINMTKQGEDDMVEGMGRCVAVLNPNLRVGIVF